MNLYTQARSAICLSDLVRVTQAVQAEGTKPWTTGNGSLAAAPTDRLSQVIEDSDLLSLFCGITCTELCIMPQFCSYVTGMDMRQCKTNRGRTQ